LLRRCAGALPTEVVLQAIFDLEATNQELKPQLRDLYITSAKELEFFGNARKAIVVHVRRWHADVPWRVHHWLPHLLCKPSQHVHSDSVDLRLYSFFLDGACCLSFGVQASAQLVHTPTQWPPVIVSTQIVC
jgi:hypothetical protein